jgi:hypothetical protein
VPQSEAASFDLNVSGDFLATPIAPKAFHTWKVILGGEIKKRASSFART